MKIQRIGFILILLGFFISGAICLSDLRDRDAHNGPHLAIFLLNCVFLISALARGVRR